MSTRHPYYRRPARSPSKPLVSDGEYVDLGNAHRPAYDTGDQVSKAQSSFDARAAACVSATVTLEGKGDLGPVRIWPPVWWTNTGPLKDTPLFWARDMLEMKFYGKPRRGPLSVVFGDIAPTIYHPTRKTLAALAYGDYFPDRPRIGRGLRSMVSAAILAADPGWGGSFGPAFAGGTPDVLLSGEGNYDMSQMHLLAIAYLYYEDISPEAREHLIEELLARGKTARPNLKTSSTSGRAPNDWDLAGVVEVDFDPLGALPSYTKNISETENHILMIATARYLTNQLLFQRHHDDQYDNRRNGSEEVDSCTSIVLKLLRAILRDDFSEYNAKPYQQETRWALLNLCSFAYDHEVRLAARMVLDYISAHIAVSSNDLRRMVPFRRRNESPHAAHDANGWMTVGLVDADPGSTRPREDGDSGADPMTAQFALQAGNTRAYRFQQWRIAGSGDGLVLDVVSDYRLPDSIHDLFVNDHHRRFFQRLHRTPRSGEKGGNRNADNMEILASSPSYLITAGGMPSDYAINPRVTLFDIDPGGQGQQLGVAVTTSFMPTGIGNGFYPEQGARSLIQFGAFYAGLLPDYNYGVAPDFACGHNLWLPAWATGRARDGFLFLTSHELQRLVAKFSHLHPLEPEDNNSHLRPLVADSEDGPGFFLAIHRSGELATLEAHDTWAHPGLTFKEFQRGVIERNGGLSLRWNEPFEYTTTNGNRLEAVLWNQPYGTKMARGAHVKRIDYGSGDPTDALRAAMTPGFTADRADAGENVIGDAGNTIDAFLSGTIMNSPAEAVVEITNPFLRTKITLNMSNPWHPWRASDTGEVEVAGSNHEVWLDSQWQGLSEGDVCRPFSTLADAVGAVAERGAIRILPGAIRDRGTLNPKQKRVRLVAPLGGVVIGARSATQVSPSGTQRAGDTVRKNDVWVQFDMPEFAVRGPFNSLTKAAAAVVDRGVIRIVPGVTKDRSTIGGPGRRFTLVAPIGGVVIGRGIWA